MKKKKYTSNERLISTVFLIAGTGLTAMGTVVFFIPNKIVCGGVSGISTILHYIANVPVGVSYALINLFLLLLGVRVLGKGFIIRTAIGTVLMSLFMELFAFVPVLTNDGMLASIFGGILYGVGLGLTFVGKGSTGGTDILGRLIQHFFPELSIGKLLAVIDGVIIAASIVVFRNLDLVLFGIIGVFIQSLAIDALINRFNVANMVWIVTDRGEYVRKYIRNKYDRGITELEAYGYANEERDKQILVCVLNAKEASELKDELSQIDPEAFVMFTEAKSIIGKGFKYYQ